MAPLPHDDHDAGHVSVQVHPVEEVDAAAGIGKYPSARSPAALKSSIRMCSSSNFRPAAIDVADASAAPLPQLDEEKGGAEVEVDANAAAAEKASSGRSVSFKDVEVRRYGITVGDNPTTINGPPITLTWDYVLRHDARQEIDAYEDRRSKSRRKFTQLKMPKDVRVKMLVDEGVSYLEIRQAELDVTKSQQQRFMTVEMIKFMKIEDFIETIVRRAKRAMKGTSKKKEQEKLWAEARRASVANSAKQ